MPDNSFRLDGRPAIVVGAALGIGRAIALTFAAAAAKVACLDIDEVAASETAARIRSAGGTAMAHRCDVTSETSIADAVKAAIAAHGGPARPCQRRSHARADWHHRRARACRLEPSHRDQSLGRLPYEVVLSSRTWPAPVAVVSFTSPRRWAGSAPRVAASTALPRAR